MGAVAASPASAPAANLFASMAPRQAETVPGDGPVADHSAEHD
jgi:hypothetical protein